MRLRFGGAEPRRHAAREPLYARPTVEGLEDRVVPAAVRVAAPALAAALSSAPAQTVVGIVPLRVTGVAVQGGQLTANLLLGGQSFTAGLTLAKAASGNPQSLDVRLDPIHVALPGLAVDTSALVLNVSTPSGSANPLGRLLGQLAGLLNGGATQAGALGSLTSTQPAQLAVGLTRLLGGAIPDVTARAAVSGASVNATTGNVLHLSVAPLNPTIQGLRARLDNGANGAVTVDMTAVPGPGNQLGGVLANLSQLLSQGSVNRGQLSTLFGQIDGAVATLLSRVATPVLPLQITGLVPAGNGTFQVSGTLGSQGFTTTLAVSTQAPAGAAPVLTLRLGAIHLSLPGLKVDTSPIGLTVTAPSGSGNLLGNLLTDAANLGNGSLTADQFNQLTGALTGLLGGALAAVTSRAALSGATLSSRTGNVLHLSLAPANLSLLGLNAALDNGAGGPATVDVTAVPGAGNPLGSFIAELSHQLAHDPLNANVINALLGRVTSAVGRLAG